jgi:predicted NAD-dependent protein-ADP-ribosyltransferase YbiA (DUF1768 family)
MTEIPLVIAYFGGDPEVKILSNFARSPFQLDNHRYYTVEAYWQMLKVDNEITRQKMRLIEDGYEAKQYGSMLKVESKQLFTYEGQLYQAGSEAHHGLLERAIRAKTGQSSIVKKTLIQTGNRPLKHMLRNKFGTWRTGDSPSLPAIVFEDIWTKIREELINDEFSEFMALPDGVSVSFSDT